MKNTIIVLIALLISLLGFAQQGINYKAIIKDDLGNVIASQEIDVKFSIIEITDTTTSIVYTEDHPDIMTDTNGVVILNIGEGTTTDDFSAITWENDTHALKVEIDLEDDATFVDLGNTEFKAVPYALNAASKLDELSDGKSDTNGSSLFIGVDAGLNDDGTNNINVGVGYKTLTSNTTGIGNSAIGNSALYSNISGGFNTAIGYSALYFNTEGDFNTAIGNSSLQSNTTGVGNTANGHSALNKNTTGNSNTANGSNALYSNITGNQNTANGSSALRLNTTGVSNTATGNSALFSNIGGGNNTANGSTALNGNTEGNYNTAIGSAALSSNTTGNRNMANGTFSLSSNTEGDFNTANGNQALSANVTGDYNTANGNSALGSNTTGDGNIALGSSAGSQNVSGSDNIFIGNGTGNFTDQSNQLYIDNSSTSTPLIYGDFNSNFVSINGYLNIDTSEPNTLTISSSNTDNYLTFNTSSGYKGYSGIFNGDNDMDFGTGDANTIGKVHLVINASPKLTVAANGKVGIGRENPSSLLEVAHLNSPPTTSDYTNAFSIHNIITGGSWQLSTVSAGHLNLYKNGSYRGFFNQTTGAYTIASDRRLKKDITSLTNGTLDKVMQLNPVSYLMKEQTDTKRNLGLISQEVQELFPSITHYVEESDLLTLSYTELIPILIKALQEQQGIIEAHKSTNSQQTQDIKNLLQRMTALEAANN